jgi:hypothetical protein
MKGSEAAVTTIGIGSIGVFVAYIFSYLNEKGIVVDQYVNEAATVEEIMAVIMIIFLLVAVVIAAARR